MNVSEFSFCIKQKFINISEFSFYQFIKSRKNKRNLPVLADEAEKVAIPRMDFSLLSLASSHKS